MARQKSLQILDSAKVFSKSYRPRTSPKMNWTQKNSKGKDRHTTKWHNQTVLFFRVKQMVGECLITYQASRKQYRTSIIGEQVQVRPAKIADLLEYKQIPSFLAKTDPESPATGFWVAI